MRTTAKTRRRSSRKQQREDGRGGDGDVDV